MEYLRTDTVSVGTLYRKDAKLSRGAGAYFCKHFVPVGAQGGGRLPTLPLRCSQGGLPSLPPACPAFPDAAGGFGGFGRLPTLPLVCFTAPIPPPPFPAGRGRIKVILCKGLRPLHPRGLNPWFAARMAGNAFLWAVPAAKERGDRGRWNYPSQATAAFEMVLSPGAGIASAVDGLMPGCRERSPRRNKL